MAIDPLTEYQAYLKSQKIAARTASAYLSDLRAFIRWFEAATGETFDPAAITRRELLDWRAALEKTSPPATLNRRLCALRAVYAWAGRRGLVSLDPTGQLRGVRPSGAAASPDPAAVEAVLRQVRTDGSRRDRALLELLADCGLRVAELAGLIRGDLQLTEGSGRLKVQGKLERGVILGTRARLALREYLEEAGDLPTEGPLFPTRRGNPMNPYAIWYTAKKYAALAGVEAIRPRHFRAAAAHRLVNDPQVGLVRAAQALGQARAETLVKYLE